MPREQASSAGPSGSSRKKRSQVPAACRACQRSKTKCDALRPCTPCVQRARVCEYDNDERESYHQAQKRKHDALLRAHDECNNVLDLLRTRNIEDATHLLHLLRKGWSPLEISRRAQYSDSGLFFRHSRQNPFDVFLGTLAHSTGSTEEIVRLTTSAILDSMAAKLPSPQRYLCFRDRIVQPSLVEGLVFRNLQPGQHLPIPPASLGALHHNRLLGSSLPRTNLTSTGGELQVVQQADDDSEDTNPLYPVPAMPWTSITQSDEAVSHLVSIFLAWLTPTWRFVEQDLFLRGMQSQDLNSQTCTPLLVNSICTIASLHTEHEMAFSVDNTERTSRGQQFHDEALRLWSLEADKASIPNVQALCILALDSNYRAIDRTGLKLISKAVQLHNELPVTTSDAALAGMSVSGAEYARLRLATHIAATSTHTIMGIAFMAPDNIAAQITDFPLVDDVFSDRIELWRAYPLDSTSIGWRPTMYLKQYRALGQLFRRMYRLILPKTDSSALSDAQFSGETLRLRQEMESWYNELPFEVQYHWPMSIDVWELHASYLTFSMVFANATRPRMEHAMSVPHPESDQHEAIPGVSIRAEFDRTTALAQRAAELLRDFRTRYETKVSPAWSLQMQAVAGGVLLQDPELTRAPDPESYSAHGTNGAIHDSHSAFEEIYRCLLGSSMEVMIARGIARIRYHTAVEKKALLSPTVQKMLEIMSGPSWRSSDVRRLDSIFPNFAAPAVGDSDGRLTNLLLKWENTDMMGQ